MDHAIAFIEELADVELRSNGVKIICRSGPEQFAFRCDLGLWREFLAREVARLNEYDAEQRKRVVRFPKPRH